MNVVLLLQVDVELVFGNESCDLDSAVCALAYAYLLHLQVNIGRSVESCTRLKKLCLCGEMLLFIRE